VALAVLRARLTTASLISSDTCVEFGLGLGKVFTGQRSGVLDQVFDVGEKAVKLARNAGTQAAGEGFWIACIDLHDGFLFEVVMRLQ
jgi:hypothetical protein